MSQLYDITIVGGGPVGLLQPSMPTYAKPRIQIIDSLPQLGGQPAILYPGKGNFRRPGFPKPDWRRVD